MKRSEMLEEIRKILAMNGKDDGMGELEEALLHSMEVLGMIPKKYVNSKAVKEFGDIIKEKGEHWGYIHYIDKYPEHHFRRGRPYEYYIEGWEPEDE
jgi:hypothetical protein